MPQGLTFPYRFSPETEADANQMNANFDAAAAKFNGGIVDGDCSSLMDLDGNKLSQTPAKRVPNLALADNAVDARVLASSASSDTGRAVSGDHIKALVAADVARILPAAGIGLDKLKLTVHDKAGTAINIGAGVTAFTVPCFAEISGGNWRASAIASYWNGVSVLSVNQVVTPSSAFPSASYALIGCFAISATYVNPNLNFTVRFVFLSLT